MSNNDKVTSQNYKSHEHVKRWPDGPSGNYR